jgi:hypothetical protein
MVAEVEGDWLRLIGGERREERRRKRCQGKLEEGRAMNRWLTQG